MTNGEKREINLRRHYKEIKPKMTFKEFRKTFKAQGDDLIPYRSFGRGWKNA